MYSKACMASIRVQPHGEGSRVDRREKGGVGEEVDRWGGAYLVDVPSSRVVL